jgi:glutamyl/glutaminyl-tRNA synthetase
MEQMKFRNSILLLAISVFVLLVARPARAQSDTQQPATPPPASSQAATKKQNTDAYIALMRRDVRQEKAEIMGATLALNAQDAAKFWPIYSDYDTALAKLNDQRIANIKDYAQHFNNITDEEADRLIQNGMSYHKQRAELLAKTYEQVKQALGGLTAARFVMVEQQILTIIDLQILSSLPIAGQSM